MPPVPCFLKGVTQFLPAVTHRVDITKGEDGELVKGEKYGVRC